MRKYFNILLITIHSVYFVLLFVCIHISLNKTDDIYVIKNGYPQLYLYNELITATVITVLFALFTFLGLRMTKSTLVYTMCVLSVISLVIPFFMIITAETKILMILRHLSLIAVFTTEVLSLFSIIEYEKTDKQKAKKVRAERTLYLKINN